MSLVPEALTTLANCKEALKISDTSQDALLTNIINRVTWWTEAQTHRKLACRNYNGKGTLNATSNVPSEDYMFLNGKDGVSIGNGMYEFYLPAYPIQRTDTNAVTFRLDVIRNRSSSGEDWDTTSLVEWQDWILDTDNGILRVMGAISREPRSYRVQATAGFLYTTTAPFGPPDLEGLAIELCKKMYRESRNVASERIGSWSRTYDMNIKDPFLEDVLARYTRIVL